MQTWGLRQLYGMLDRMLSWAPEICRLASHNSMYKLLENVYTCSECVSPTALVLSDLGLGLPSLRIWRGGQFQFWTILEDGRVALLTGDLPQRQLLGFPISAL